MQERKLLVLLVIVLFPFFLRGAFDEKNDMLWHPAFSSYSFLPADYLSQTKLLFATSGARLYSMDECNEVQTCLHVSLPFARIGIAASYFGSELYNESMLGISLLKGTQTALGTRLKAMRLGFKNYDTRFLGSDDIFFISHHSLFHFQTCFNNALSFGYRSEAEKPVTSFTSLIRLYPARWYSLNFRMSFSELTGTGTEIGNGFKVSEYVWIGGGFDLQTKKLASHLMVSFGRTSLSYAIAVHPALGITHTAGIIFMVPKQKGSLKE